MTIAALPVMTRPRRVVIGGVCAGLAEHLRWPLGAVRAGMVLLALLGGAGVLLYLWLWALTPLAGENDEGVTRRMPGAAALVALAAITAVVAGVFDRVRVAGASSLASVVASGASDETVAATKAYVAYTAFAAESSIVGAAVFGVAAVAWSLGLDRRDPARGPGYGRTVRGAASVIMVGLGVVLLFGSPAGVTAVLAVLLIMLGSAVFVIPRLVTLWGEVLAERSGRVREEQRAEIAAHLHDSVLQTLALIQNRAGPSSEVARIARAQERELRDWLFAGAAAAAQDVAVELKDVAADIELEYAARLDVVATGESTLTSSALVAAAREAMLNAARHVGGEVSVYIESTPSAVDVFVRDRGSGFDIDALPADRLGIRESIIGRMQRAGGSATVRSTASGTEVHLHLEGAPA